MEIKSSTKYFAELVGTFSLVLFGCGTAVVAGVTTGSGPDGVGLLGIAIAFGFTVVAMCYAIGGISGCHVNPAITIAMLTAGKIKANEALGYIIAQFIGATLAAGVLYLIQGGDPHWALGEWGLGSNGWGEGYGAGYNTASAFIAEAVFTFLFLFVIFASLSKWGNSTMAGLAIGVTLMLIHLVCIRITGTSVNPARSFGPAVFAGGKALGQLWLFIVAPIVGGVLAAIVWKMVDKQRA
ncbi:MIP family channel protein [Chitinophaga lutea]